MGAGVAILRIQNLFMVYAYAFKLRKEIFVILSTNPKLEVPEWNVSPKFSHMMIKADASPSTPPPHHLDNQNWKNITSVKHQIDFKEFLKRDFCFFFYYLCKLWALKNCNIPLLVAHCEYPSKSCVGANIWGYWIVTYVLESDREQKSIWFLYISLFS